MDWLSFGVIGGCVMMFVIVLVWHQYKKRIKADEEARADAQKMIEEIAEKEKKEGEKKQLKAAKGKEKQPSEVAAKRKETK